MTRTLFRRLLSWKASVGRLVVLGLGPVADLCDIGA